ncbi:MAG: hypothetical protein IT327_03105 [Anaerolineae bacterium]|nr:hypothetical protein [Anaerolineae bacterium]
MAKQRLAIVRGQRINNRSAKGNPAYGQLKGLMNYLAYGRYIDQPTFALRPGSEQALGHQSTAGSQQRGLWLDHNGAATPHSDALHWAKEKVHAYGYDYTYQLLLSTRHGGLLPDDFNHVLAQGSVLSGVEEWRLMLHADTNNQHAHVILLRQEKLAKAQYTAWQQKMQAALEQLQVERYQERQETEITHSTELGQDLAAAFELEHPETTQRRGWEIGL